MTTSTLRVLTWNVGEVYWPWEGNQLKHRDVDVVRAAVVELDPDVVLLQELLDDAQLRAIAGNEYAAQLAEACGYDRHVGLLVKQRFAPEFHDHLLSPTPRGAVEARFSIDGQLARAFSLHLDVFNPPRRLVQVRAAAALIGDDPRALTVAGGDFNFDPAASARLGQKDDLVAEQTLGEKLHDVAAGSGPTLIGLLRVDRLFAGGPLVAGAHAFTAPHRTPLGDHAPLVCDLALHRRH